MAYKTSQKWKENIYKNVQNVMNIYFDDVLINPDYILDLKKGGDVFDENIELGSTPSQYIELQVLKDQVAIPEQIRIEYGILINYALTVEEVNAMLVGTLNGIPVKSLSAYNSSFEMIPIGRYNIDDYTDNDDGTLTIKALDNIINLDADNGYYDASEIIGEEGDEDFGATLGEIFQDICTKKGVVCGSTSFLNSNKKVYVYDNQLTARQYVSYIAECAGGFACAGRDGKIYIKHFYEDETELSIDLFGEFKWGEEYQVSRVAYEDGVRSYKFGNETRNTLWIRQDNMFIVDSNEVQNIFNELNGLTINSFEGTTIIDPAIDIGDKIIIDGNPIIYQGEMSLNGRFIADIRSKINIKQKQETTVRKESQTVINRKVQSEIDQENLRITQLVSQVGDRSQKTTTVTQDIDSIDSRVTDVEEDIDDNYYTKIETNSQINQKAGEITSQVSSSIQTAKSEAISSANSSTDEKLLNYSTTSQMNSAINQKANEISARIDEIEDVTNTVEGTKTITLENCVEGDLLELHIYGNNNVFKYLYPANDLYPANNLYPYGDSRIEVVNFPEGSEVGTTYTYELGVTNVLRQNGEVCDEYVLQDGKAKVIRRINSDGTIKATETEEDLGEFYIKLPVGTNVISIKNYSAKLKAKYAITNDFTDIFATKVEMSSSIEAKSNEINAKVEKKVDEETITGAYLVLKINKDESSGKLSADKIELSANDVLNLLSGNEINLSGKNITIKSDNFNVDSQGNLDANNVRLRNVKLNNLQITGNNMIYQPENGTYQYFKIMHPTDSNISNKMSWGDIEVGNGGNYKVLIVGDESSNSAKIDVDNGSSLSQITPVYVMSPRFINQSLYKYKKNFKKLENGLDIIKKTDIYKYNLKSEADDDKKHIGFVIGKKYRYSKEITSLDNEGKEIGVDTYSMISVAYKAIQEQQETIEKLQEKIKELEER